MSQFTYGASDSCGTSFINALSRVAGVKCSDIQELMSDADISHSPSLSGERLSTLNNDGYPVQACITAAQGLTKVRLLFDPASDEQCPVLRYQRASDAFNQLPATDGGRELVVRMKHMLTGFLPVVPSISASIPSGLIWLACDVRSKGLAVYTSAKWCSSEKRWDRVMQWLDSLSNECISDLLTGMSSIADVVSVGLEGSTPDDLRVKIYFRQKHLAHLSDMGIPLFSSEEVVEFLRLAIGEYTLSRSGLVFSVSIKLSTASIEDIKIDVCGHCTPRTSEAWNNLTGQLADTFDLAGLLSADEELSRGNVEVAFLGFGIDAERAPRMNVYYKPRSEHHAYS